jgi:hypothetical protein
MHEGWRRRYMVKRENEIGRKVLRKRGVGKN